ncbi:hypothetical protein Psesu_1615 [Pseudoxanthomonas suwonensis 11-1]|uniref:Uncharacterized protein n=1 Tax=Pseudoxanthomonas suwonensis (strain 11-1) TaxID=743721 RepID=E6WTG1_PSEUU|nr:hypothetical protein [Pseudoxanthomonas suwonensis]ADV27460.1 hypothetical protein Psesu_1615 [Pseudoxanthomonas suwonensis 11-1]
MTITVYLDSADYSLLSEERLDGTQEKLRDALFEFSRRPNLIFAYSGVHISEMAPLRATYTSSASARVGVLSALCKRNALMSTDQLVESEIRALSARSEVRLDIFRPDGSWFPDVGGIAKPSMGLSLMREIKGTIDSLAPNRKARRAARSNVWRGDSLRRKLADKLSTADLDNFLAIYPMRPADALTLNRYVFGLATPEDADNAFFSSLRDPEWMMRWFANHHDELNPIVQWVRRPAEKLLETMEGAIGELKRYRIAGVSQVDELLSIGGWKLAQDELLIKVANRIGAGLGLSQLTTSAEDIDKFCPGLSASVRTAHTSVRNSLLDGSRKLKKSDFVDALHCMYSPYIDVFRADKYTASIVRPLLKNHRTHVCSSLCQVTEVLKVMEAKGVAD